jgi:hypothetical protein
VKKAGLGAFEAAARLLGSSKPLELGNTGGKIAGQDPMTWEPEFDRLGRPLAPDDMHAADFAKLMRGWEYRADRQSRGKPVDPQGVWDAAYSPSNFDTEGFDSEHRGGSQAVIGNAREQTVPVEEAANRFNAAVPKSEKARIKRAAQAVLGDVPIEAVRDPYGLVEQTLERAGRPVDPKKIRRAVQELYETDI